MPKHNQTKVVTPTKRRLTEESKEVITQQLADDTLTLKSIDTKVSKLMKRPSKKIKSRF